MKKLTKLSLLVLVVAGLTTAAQAQNTTNNFTGVTTGSVLTTGNWSLGHVPTVSEDAVFPVTATTGIRTFNNGSLTVGSFDVLATTGTFTLRNATNSTTSTLTLGGAGDLGNAVSGAPADLLFNAAGSTFVITGVNGTAAILNVVLGQSGNFDAAGTMTVSAVVSDGGSNRAVTKTGAGTLNLSGANTHGGGTTLSTGTLGINNGGTSATNSALGTGTFTIAGGTITNTSGADVTVATNNAQTWSGDFTFAGGSGTNSINLGTGNVTLTGNRAVVTTGTTSTLTVGGSIGDGGNGFSLTKNGSGTGTLILSAANTYGGGTFISKGSLVANHDGALGTGNVNLLAGAISLTLQNGATQDYINNNAGLSIVNGTTVNLNFVGTDIVSSLVIDGVAQADGIYNSVNVSEFLGTGSITVLTVVPEPSVYMLLGVGILLCGQRFFRRKSA